MATSNIKALIPGELRKVWELVLDVENYGAWRSDLSKTEVISDKQFIEYTKDGYPTTFTVTLVKPYRRWEFDMENNNMKGIERKGAQKWTQLHFCFLNNSRRRFRCTKHLRMQSYDNIPIRRSRCRNLKYHFQVAICLPVYRLPG